MATKSNIEDAAKIVMDAEVAALNLIKTALDDLDAKMAEVEASLPTTLLLDARRIVTEMRGSVAYRRTSEIPNLLARYNPGE